jgi:hypothetical protein
VPHAPFASALGFELFDVEIAARGIFRELAKILADGFRVALGQKFERAIGAPRVSELPVQAASGPSDVRIEDELAAAVLCPRALDVGALLIGERGPGVRQRHQASNYLLDSFGPCRVYFAPPFLHRRTIVACPSRSTGSPAARRAR